MDNKDFENMDELSPEALVEKLKEKLAIDRDTYSKLVDENEAPSKSADNDNDVYGVLDVFAESQGEPQDSSFDQSTGDIDDLLDEDFIGEFESTAEIESPLSMKLDNDDNLDEIHDLFDNAQAVYESADDDEEGLETLNGIFDIQADENASVQSEIPVRTAIEEPAQDPVQAPTQSQSQIPNDEDDFVRAKLKQLFSDFDEETPASPEQFEKTAEFDLPDFDEELQSEPTVNDATACAADDVYTQAAPSQTSTAAPPKKPKVYYFRKYDPTDNDATKLHQAVSVSDEEEDNAKTRLHEVPDLESPDLNVMQTFGASVDHVRELYGDNVATEYEKVLTTPENNVKLAAVDDEYVSKSQNQSIIDTFKRKISRYKIKIVFSVIA